MNIMLNNLITVFVMFIAVHRITFYPQGKAEKKETNLIFEWHVLRLKLCKSLDISNLWKAIVELLNYLKYSR